ncbi:MAG: hypothetical protein Q6363_007335 [Candidatus Njordarchaeota archaeon]
MLKKTSISILIIFTITMLYPISCSAQADNAGNITIAIDNSHDPVSLNFSKAFKYLNQSLNNKVYTHYINGTINSSTLSGTSIYIILPSNKTFSDNEKNIIKSYLRRGGIVIIMGMEYIKNRDFNPDIIIMDDLLSSIPFDFKVRFNYTKGLGNVLVDPLSQDYYLHITEEMYTKSMRDFLGGTTFDLVLMSTIITVEASNISSLKIIRPPAWSYALCGDGTILYFESGASIFFAKKFGSGLLITLGFATSLSDIIVPEYNLSWIDIAENREFWITLIKSALNVLQEKSLFQYSTLIWLIPLGAGTFLIIYGLVMSVITKKKRKVTKEKPEEPKISEIIKKMREKKK